jgi:hypothetical protein
MAENYTPAQRFDFTNNVADNGQYGFMGTGTAEGAATLNAYFADWSFEKNAIVGGQPSLYPPSNFFPVSMAAVGFIDYTGKNYRLSSSSRYKKAGTDGKDLGANIGALEAALSASDRRRKGR